MMELSSSIDQIDGFRMSNKYLTNIVHWGLRPVSICSPSVIVRKAGLICLTACFITLVYRPFDTSYGLFYQSLIVFIGLSVVIALTYMVMDIILYYAIIPFMRRFYGFHLATYRFLTMVVIGFAIAVYDGFFGSGHAVTMVGVLGFTLKIMAVFSIFGMYYISVSFYKERYFSKEVFQHIPEVIEGLTDQYKGHFITISSEKASEIIRLPLNDLLYIRAMQNYIEVVSKESDDADRKIIRGTLKDIQNALEQYPLIRIHRSYLVNLMNISAVKRRAQGLEVTLFGLNIPLPISRSYTKAFKERLLADFKTK